MLNISDEIKNLYKSDAPKKYSIIFPTLTITNNQLVSGGFSLEESLFSDKNLKFGSCEAGMIKFTVADIEQDLKGMSFDVIQTIEENEIPIGSYIVYSCKKQNNKRFKDIIAYDKMTLFDKDVSAWYNSLIFPLSLSQFRASLLSRIGITEVTKTLPNDTMNVYKTIEPSQISGRDVIQACEEINGCFGHINRYGQFEHIILKTMHEDYPQNDYPGNDYPEDEPYDEYIGSSQYINIDFEEYRVAPITKIQIRQEENDIGYIYGSGDNTYIIQGNFLVFGKTAQELQAIASNLSQNVFYRGYRPYKATNIGLPYVEVGDFVKYNANDTTAGFVFERILTGIQGLKDEFSAEGEEELTQSFGLNNEIIQQKGRMTKIEKSVDGVRVEVSDLDKKLTGEIEVLAGQVILKVNSNGKIGYVALNADPDTDLTEIVLKADNISLEGLTTINGNFKVLLDGTIEAVNGKFSGDITASSFIGGYLQSLNYIPGTSGMKIDLSTGTIYIESGATFTSQGATYNTTIDDGRINTEFITMEAFSAINIDASHQCYFDYTGFHTDVINGSAPITSGNIGTQSVSYATSAGSAPVSAHTQASTTITPVQTAGGNIAFSGLNGASVNWCNATFQPLSASDFRLKKNIQSLENIPDELFMAIKTKQYEFKTDVYGKGISFGILAQELESAFMNFGLDPYAYNLIELADVRDYTDEGLYVDDKVHRINYQNLIAWSVYMIQKLYSRII